MELKSLAHKVLERNRASNYGATTARNVCNTSLMSEGSRKTSHDKPVTKGLEVLAYDERAAIIQANGVPKEWAEGFALLCTMERPSDYTPERWQQIVDDAGYFLDVWGDKAAALSWDVKDVFGVNPEAPEQRYDAMGLLVSLRGRRVVAITADTARLDCDGGAKLTFYRDVHGERSVLWSMAEAI